jgi:hypothetical protein
MARWAWTAAWTLLVLLIAILLLINPWLVVALVPAALVVAFRKLEVRHIVQPALAKSRRAWANWKIVTLGIS